MSVIQHLVPPKLPTALADETHVDLPGYDIFVVYIDTVHVIPTKLDVSKFEDALSRVLQQYPHAAGQLRCIDGCWSIELTNSSVPVVIECKLDMSADSVLDGNWVVQDDLSSLLNQHPYSTKLVNGDAPLLRIKLTLFENEACVGVSVSHSIGDGTAVSRLLHMLSQFYQGLPFELVLPTFKKHHFPAPSESMLAELSSRMPLHPLHSFDAAAFVKGRTPTEHVRWEIDVHDLEKLRSALGSSQKTYLSKQDCLTAYVVAVLNCSRADPVCSVRIMSSYRHVQAPFITESVAGNMCVIVPAGTPMDMGGTASAVRNALIQSREPRCIYLLESVKSAGTLAAMNAGAPAPFVPQADGPWVNSHMAIDWYGAHFGFPDGTRFHMHGVFKNLLQFYKSNPTKGKDGVWHSRSSFEFSTGVAAGQKTKILEVFARGIQYMLDQP